MYIVVNHTINNTEDFWTSAQKHLPNLPEGGVRRVLHVFPNQAMDNCTCVWEADSIEKLEQYFQDKLAHASTQTCFQVNEAAAVGLEV
ncbi:MAG: hypothetical protein EOO14_23065 [Chitinophagaceae bacterium]|nr:MAG: hypothetical protein EOO14_23065 [Chitinophagaceae bacterium]